MRDLTALQRFIAWRWSPCVALSSGSVMFVLVALLAIPVSAGHSSARHDATTVDVSAPEAPAAPDLAARLAPPHGDMNASLPSAAATATSKHRTRVRRVLPPATPATDTPAGAPGNDHAVNSFFPNAAAPELPPPLEDEPPPPEPSAQAP